MEWAGRPWNYCAIYDIRVTSCDWSRDCDVTMVMSWDDGRWSHDVTIDGHVTYLSRVGRVAQISIPPSIYEVGGN